VNKRTGKPKQREHLSVVRSRNTREKKSPLTHKKEKNAKKNKVEEEEKTFKLRDTRKKNLSLCRKIGRTRKIA
jgi:hypothetical protein